MRVLLLFLKKLDLLEINKKLPWKKCKVYKKVAWKRCKVYKKVCLVEVKAVSGNSKSSSTILNNYELYKVDQLVKITSKNIGFIDNKLTIPHYLTFLLF